tara:strand:- start:4341 stop:4889 length:549 start_codon:yes stop_codon:yes gene_type:complete
MLLHFFHTKFEIMQTMNMSYSTLMDIQSILQSLLRNDLCKMVHKRSPNTPFSEILKHVDKYIAGDPPLFEIQSGNPNKRIKQIPPDEERCCARTWNHNQGTRCTQRRKRDSECPEYCGTHNRELTKRGYLKFHRYDEPRPEINAEGSRIPWYDTTPMESLQIILDYHGAYLKTHLKRPKVTP